MTVKDKLILELSGGDREKFVEVYSQWGFKNHQCLLRFIISIMLVTEDQFLAIRCKGEKVTVAPAEGFIR